jgi:CHAT domain-containing protein
LVGPEELAALRFNADLVVLSSCRSAGGVVVNGEGLQGLTAPLVQAGARSVLASQWEVGDRDALEFIRSFYRHVAEGQSVGEALRRAKVDGIARGTSPREWAAFTMVGDPLVHVPLRAPRGVYWPSLLGLAAAALVFFYWLRIRSRRSGELR